MSITSKVLAATATLAIVGGVITVGTMSAKAATPQCGPRCVGIFSRAYGTPEHPNFVETVRDGVAMVGQPTVLVAASNSNPAEDFMPHGGSVASFFAAGMVPAAVNSHYGSLNAVQVEYAPLGVPSGLCAGLAHTAYQNEGLTLQPCSVPATTVWILDTTVSPAPGYFALVNGSTTDFRRPFAMTYNVDPARRAAQIRVGHLRVSNDKGEGEGTVPDTQLWGSVFGDLH